MGLILCIFPKFAKGYWEKGRQKKLHRIKYRTNRENYELGTSKFGFYKINVMEMK
jgi:hypothetical protein